MQGVAVLPGRRLAGGGVHAGDPPAADLLRARRVRHVDDHQDVVGEAVEQRRGIGIAPADPPDAVQAETGHLHRADLSRIGRIGNVVDIHAGGVVLAALAEAAAVHLAGPAVVFLLRQQRPLICLLDAQQHVVGRLEVHAHGVRMHRHEVHRLRIARVAHVGDHHAASHPCADVCVAACHHHLDAVAAAALVGVADKFNVPRAFRDDHDLLPSLISRQLRPGSKD